MDGLIRAIKSDGGEWIIEILGVPFGSPSDRDSDGEFFTAQTKLHLDKFPTPPLLYYHGFDEQKQPAAEPIFVGKTIGYEVRNDGVWFRGVLDKAIAQAKAVWDAALAGMARASSGSIAHLVRKTRDGMLLEWPLAELSVFDIYGGKNPANRRAVVTPVMKAVYDQAGLTLPDDIEGEAPEAETIEIGDGQSSVDAGDRQQQTINSMTKTENTTMNEEQVARIVAEAMKAEQDKRVAEESQKKQQEELVAQAVKAALVEKDKELASAKAEAAEARRLPGGNAPYQTKFNNIAKYDDLDITDAAVLAGIISSAKMANRSAGVSEDLRKYLAIQLAEHEDKDRQFVASKTAMKMAGMPVKANELNQSTLASYGDEWIGVTYSTQLWDKIRLAAPIAARVPTITIPQGSESIVIPLNSTAPTFYKVAQASAQDANPGRVTATFTTSKKGTGSKTLTVSKLGAAINYTGELEEDSLIPWVSELRKDLTLEAAEVLEHIIIDGDTETGATTNINDIGGTPAGTEAFMLFNGFRKLALVTNTANSRSAGALAIADYLETVKLLGLAGRNAVDKKAVSILVDTWTHWKSLELPEVATRDVFVAPTIEQGMLTNVYGYEVITAANMHRANQDATYGYKANTSGKIDLDTASNNTTGSILAVRWDQWRLGYKRQMTFEVERDAISDSTNIVVMMRVGMVNRDTEASAISYGVTL